MKKRHDGIIALGKMNSWGISIIDTRKVSPFIWLYPMKPAIRLFRFVVGLNAPVPYPMWHRRLTRWLNQRNGLAA